MKYYNNTRIGQIMARITGDLFEVTEFAHHCPEEFLIAALKLTSAFVILSAMNLTLTLLVFAFVPFMIVSMRWFNGKMREAFAQCRGQVGEINAQVEDSLQGMRVVQSFTNEDIETEKFGRGNSLFLILKKKQYRYMAGFHTSSRLFDGIAYMVVVAAGALFLARGRITPGEYAAYLLYVATLLGSIRRIVDFTEQYQRGVTGIERFFQIMDAPFEIHDLPGAVEAKNVRGDVRFEHVSFRYGDDGRDVLSGINLAVSAGENVAVVGPSGSGKTTLCNLIPRFYDVTGGHITLDERNIREFTLKSLRGAIGMVQQEAYLFAGTVYENIAYGKPGASAEQVRAAAGMAGADAFIAQLPDGYDTYVGERGVKLSGGQKQRISIARLFLKNPPVLILDEATSSLDNESERAVQQSLEALAHGRTTFTIAHRLTTIRNASIIWVLTGNGIEERGTHAELMARGGLYASLYAMAMEKPAGAESL
jgi:ATP-binding cassette, subfamily B, bacterial